jgi:6-phosphogluconolactonase
MDEFFKTQILSSPQETVDQLAADLTTFCNHRLNYQPLIFIALSGGSTPQILFSVLAANYSKAVDWKRLHFFWVDERMVPFSSDQSNFGVANRLFFSKIDIPEANLHFIHYTDNPLNEVQRYTDEILAHLPIVNNYPVFDLVLLGMGDDGHTASIFPGQLDLFEAGPVCAVSAHPKTGQKRITLTGGLINHASEIVFLVSGSAKAQKIKSIFEGSPDAVQYPANKIHPVTGRLSWYLDKEAAESINVKK